MNWLKKDKILLEKLLIENEKLNLYFKDVENGKIVSSNIDKYGNEIYHEWIKKNIKILQARIDKCKQNGYRLKNYRPKFMEEKLGLMMQIFENRSKC